MIDLAQRGASLQVEASLLRERDEIVRVRYRLGGHLTEALESELFSREAGWSEKESGPHPEWAGQGLTTAPGHHNRPRRWKVSGSPEV